MKIRKHRRLLSLLYALGVIAVVALPALITAAAKPPLEAATSPGRDGQGMIIRGMQAMATTVHDRLQLMALAWPDLLRFPALLPDMLTGCHSLVLIITFLAVNALLGLGVDRFLGTPQQAKGPARDGARAEATTPPADEAESVAEACARADYSAVIVRNLRIALSVLGLLLLDRIWNIDLERIIGASMGQRVAEAVFTIIVTLILASVAWGLVKAAEV